jgi:signal peptidase
MYVKTESMEPEIPKSAIVTVKKVPPTEIKVGDDITFFISENVTATHRVLTITEDYNGSGKYAFETKGIANISPDGFIVEDDVVGKVVDVFDTESFTDAIWRNKIYILIICVLFGGLIFTLKKFIAEK